MQIIVTKANSSKKIINCPICEINNFLFPILNQIFSQISFGQAIQQHIVLFKYGNTACICVCSKV